MSIALLTWFLAALLAQEPAASSAAPASLDYEFFKTRVQPILLAKRPGHARCYSCHSQREPMQLQQLPPGRTTWNEEESRKNFESVRRMVFQRDPMKSPLLRHPLTTEAGGDLYHSGGKHWDSQSAQEWQTLLAWVRGQTKTSSASKN